MSRDKRAILFVTDEAFFPPRNGSSRIYSDLAAEYRGAGWRVGCLSFCKDWKEAGQEEVTHAYARAFDSFRLLPGPSCKGTITDVIGYALRELLLWTTGNVFSRNPLLRYDEHHRRAREWLAVQSYDVIYFHKVHSAVIATGLLLRSSCWQIMDVHDDFVERGVQYRRAYAGYFKRVGLLFAALNHPRALIRFALGRVSAKASRRSELAILGAMDEIRIESPAEFQTYSRFAGLQGKLRLQPWRLQTRSDATSLPRTRPCFQLGFIGSGDVMNIDAVLAFHEQVLPIVAKSGHTPSILICGPVAETISRLLPPASNISYHAYVADVGQFYSLVGRVVAPLRFGTGVSVKVMEALSYRRPVIATPVGARGVSPHPLLTVTDDWSSMARAIIGVMDV